jgi:TetR/AcrR family transcriptional regulator
MASKKRPIPLNQNDALTTEQKILLAARREFSEKGLDGARMQAIANHAGTNKALLHYYFRSKNKLFEVTLQSIVSDLWDDVNRQLYTHQMETDLRALITAIVSAYITAFAAQPALPKMIIREITLGSPVFYGVINNFISSLNIVPKTIFSIYNKALGRGTIRRIEAIHFMMNLMGMCAATFVIKPIVEYIGIKTGAGVTFDRKFYEKRIAAITEMACDGIFIEKRNPAKQDQEPTPIVKKIDISSRASHQFKEGFQ